MNVVADALSRRHSLLVCFDAKLLGFEMLKELYANDVDFSEVYKICVRNPHENTSWMRDFCSMLVSCVCLTPPSGTYGMRGT